MKRFSLPVAISLLIAAIWITGRHPTSVPVQTAPRAGSMKNAGTDIYGAGNQEREPSLQQAEEGAARVRMEEALARVVRNELPAAVSNELRRRTLALTPEWVAELATGPDQTTFALPDGRTATVIVEQRYTDSNGNPNGVEGRLLQPGKGRFSFRVQPPGDLAGPVTGTVVMITDPVAYRVIKELHSGTSLLTELPKGEVICLMPPPPENIGTPEEIPAEHPTTIPIPPYQNGVIPLQSLPGAVGVIYLDFDGEPGPHEGWGDFDALPSGATNSQILVVWARVAEDFAPFKLNVTTDLQVYLDAPSNSRQRCIVTPTKNAAPTAGGVAYIGSFNSAGDSPCWGFYSTGKNAAEVISHEIGHTLGLSHDGRSNPSEDYYGGHGTDPVGWAPIMGVGYSKNLSQWSKGEYARANQLQDDLSIIATQNNNSGYRTDDAGPAHATAAILEIFGAGTVDDEGVISHPTDVDAFRFTTTGGMVSLAVAPVANGPDLDISAAIYDAAGNQLLVSNPDTALNATLSTSLGAGEYTVRVEGVGRGDPLTTGYTDYGSLGQYSITGTIGGTTGPTRFTLAENPAMGAVLGKPALRNTHSTQSLSWAITAGNTPNAFVIDPATGEISVATPSVIDYEGLSGNWVNPPVFALTVTVSDPQDSSLDETLPVIVTITDRNESPTISGSPVIALARTVPGTVLGTVAASDPDTFDYLSFSIIAGNSAGKFSIDAAGRILSAGSWDTIQPSHTLTIRATDHGTPVLTADTTVNVTIVPVAATYTPGFAYHTFYDELSGTALSTLTGAANFPYAPHREIRISDFTDNTRGNNYGSTIRTWLIAPVAGNYRFWISGDDSTELYFNAAGNPDAVTRIAYRTSATGYQNFTVSSTQQSAAFTLAAGQVCYLEARHKEATGGDHVSVGWEIKDSSTTATLQALQVIPGRYLSPHLMNYAPRVAALESTLYRNAWRGATVARPTAVDVNPGQGVAWSITGGNGGNLFAIDPATGRISVADAAGLAASTVASIPVTVTATDNGPPARSSSAVITISLRAADFITTAGIFQEFWDGVSTGALSSLYNLPRYQSDRPDRLQKLSVFDSGEDIADNYGARIRVLVNPPTTGAYRFYISSDDNSTLRMNTAGATSAGATQIASVSGYTDHLNWTQQTSQTSAEITLTAGQKYFLEAIVKEGTGGDHVEVAWTGPGITTPTLLGDANTEPYDSNNPPAFGAASYTFITVSDSPQGQLVGTVTASDSPFEEITYSILSGNGGGAFVVHPTSGAITVAVPSGLVPGASYPLQVGAQDTGHGRNFAPRTTTIPVVVNVPGPDQPPQFPNPPTLGPHPVNRPLAMDLATIIVDPGDPLTFSLVSGPAWLTLSSQGMLAGTPTTAHFGNHTLTISVSDTHGHTVQGSLQLVVKASDAVAGQTLPLTAATGSMITGTSTGTSANAATADNTSFVLTEVKNGTAPNELSLLEYRWNFTTPPDRLGTLRVKAHHTSNTEGDDFRFSVSTDGGASFQDAMLVTTTAYSSLIQTHTFTTGSTGQVIVKVVDTDRTPGRNVLHNLAIDLMALDLLGNEPPVLGGATFEVVPHANIGTLLGTVQATAGDIGQSLTLAITAGNEAGFFAIDGQGRLTVAGDIPVSPASYSLVVAGVDSGTPPLAGYALVTINVNGTLTIASDGVTSWSGGTHVHGSLVNNGTLRLADPAILDISGQFTNNGVLDLIHWTGTLPAGFVNHGIILDRSSLKVLSSSKAASTFQLTVTGYAGHQYQLKTALDLSGTWVDSGAPVTGTGTPAAPQQISLSAPASEAKRFYRVEITPAF